MYITPMKCMEMLNGKFYVTNIFRFPFQVLVAVSVFFRQHHWSYHTPSDHPDTSDPEPLHQTHIGPRKTAQGVRKHTPAWLCLARSTRDWKNSHFTSTRLPKIHLGTAQLVLSPRSGFLEQQSLGGPSVMRRMRSSLCLLSPRSTAGANNELT